MGLRSSFGNFLGLKLTRSLYRNTRKNMLIQSLLPWLDGKSSASAGKSGLAGNMPDSAQICHGGKSSAWAGKSGLAGNMPDSAQLCHGRFTNSAPADAIVAALAGSECHQPGTASVQLPIWH
ncbi:hypothetical protein V6N13_109338 [Hibiscus sabdariffa]